METTEKVTRVNLASITVSETNKMFRKPAELTKKALKELSDSITQLDVIQPIGVRPDPEKTGQYILIWGERRFKASMLAGRKDIPAYIRTVSEEKAFEIQVTENLQREDIHPLNEAKGYRHFMDTADK